MHTSPSVRPPPRRSRRHRRSPRQPRHVQPLPSDRRSHPRSHLQLDPESDHDHQPLGHARGHSDRRRRGSPAAPRGRPAAVNGAGPAKEPRPARGRRSAWAACIALLAVAGDMTAQEERPQTALARDLRSDDAARVMSAFGSYQRLPMEQRSPELRQALVGTIIRNHEGREPTYSVKEIQALIEAMLELGRSGDPVVIPAIVLFPQTGKDVYEMLLQFGRPALAGVLGTLSREHMGSTSYAAALEALAFFVDHRGVEAFDETTYSQMRDHAGRTLALAHDSSGSRSSLNPAILLASLLDDPGLQGLIAELAESTSAIRARGIHNQRWVERIQRNAQDALDGRLVPWWRD